MNGQPNYLILGRDGQELVPKRAYNLDVEAYIDFLKSGVEAYNKNEIGWIVITGSGSPPEPVIVISLLQDSVGYLYFSLKLPCAVYSKTGGPYRRFESVRGFDFSYK